MDMERRSLPHSLVRHVNRVLPTGWLKASALVHLAALVAIVVDYRLWAFALGAVVANHVLLAAGGLLPRSRLLGLVVPDNSNPLMTILVAPFCSVKSSSIHSALETMA